MMLVDCDDDDAADDDDDDDDGGVIDNDVGHLPGLQPSPPWHFRWTEPLAIPQLPAVKSNI